MRHAVESALVGLSLVGIGWACSPAVSHEAARTAFRAELNACVDNAKTPAEGKACIQRVADRWGVDGGAP